ncbi:hypothetical protein L53_06160 [Hyphomonas sp. L-53-1-40]|nr:hypothetical protein L53_06160 [Hyphomonas sp. L-53-1-40]
MWNWPATGKNEIDRAGRLREAGLSDTGINFKHRPSLFSDRNKEAGPSFQFRRLLGCFGFGKFIAQFQIPCEMCARLKSVFHRA